MKALRTFWVLVLLGMSGLAGEVFGSGSWQTLANPATAAVQLMILLPDGTVLAANNPSTSSTNIGFVWYRLTPDPNGHYVLGEWSDISPMHDSRLFYSSEVVPDGRLFVAGGEYGSGSSRAEIYDPLADAWTQVNPPALLLDPTQLSPDVPTNFHGGFQAFFDSESKLLPDGSVMIAPVGPKVNKGILIYNAASNSWSNGHTTIRYQDEASWVKLADDSILTVDPFTNTTERYIPSLTNWITDSNVPVTLYSPVGDEIGPALLLPNGKAFFLGGSGHTAIYTPSGATNAGSWVAGPDIPNGLTACDAPAAMMPNGKILCAVGDATFLDDTGMEQFPTPTSFFEYDYTVGATGAFTQVNGPTGLTDNGVAPFETAMLVLPDGSVLFSDSTEQNLPATGAKLYVYVPDGTQLASGKPVITSITPNADGSFHLVGMGLNGISEGAAYGDDAQMNGNYPIVQFQDTNNGHIDYGRTYNWSSTGVRTGSTPVTTEFVLPAGLLPQNYLVSVSANGIVSDPVLFSFVSPSSLALCPGGNGSLSVITTPQPATYQWYQNGNPVSGQTSNTLTITNAATNQSGLYTLKVTSGGGSVISTPVPVSVGVWEISQPSPTNSAVICQPKTLTVVARGKGTLSAQWFHNSNLIATNSRVTETGVVQNGATTFTLNFANAEYQDDATYNVMITDDCGPVGEAPFAMRVTPNPPWVQVATNGPPPRWDAAMAYDSDRHVTVLFGGAVYNPTGLPVVGDTWEFDGTNWTQRLPAAAPAARSMANMVYDSNRHRSVLYGGQVYTVIHGFAYSPETWEWDGSNWLKITTANLPPWTNTTGFGYAACYDSARGETLLFGGVTSSGILSQLWGYDGTNWHMKSPAGTAPVYSAICTTMAFDTNRGMAVLVGPQGVTVPNIHGQSVWEWDGSVWHERPQSGQVPFLNAANNAFAYDTFRQECVLYGLEDGLVDGVIADTLDPYPDGYRFVWRWNGQQWQADPPTPTVGVAYHQNHSMSFDIAQNAIVVFGGLIETGEVATNYTYEILYQDDPAILKQPTVQVSFLGQQVQLSVLAAGAPPISYQWEKGGMPLSDTGNITGTATNTLTIHSTGTTDTGVYQVVLNNLCGMTTSQPISLTVSAGQLMIGISGGHVQVTWGNPAATLQSAPEVTGPWTSLTGVMSPYQVTSPINRTFFRLIQ